MPASLWSEESIARLGCFRRCCSTNGVDRYASGMGRQPGLLMVFFSSIRVSKWNASIVITTTFSASTGPTNRYKTFLFQGLFFIHRLSILMLTKQLVTTKPFQITKQQFISSFGKSLIVCCVIDPSSRTSLILWLTICLTHFVLPVLNWTSF